MTNDKDPVDISEARKRRAEILQQYSDPLTGMQTTLEAAWRVVWADVCKEKEKTIPFEEWFYATDENGDCPFEVAGFAIVSQGKK
jgi:hypothetical protein